MSEQYMVKKEFADLFRVSSRTVNRWMAVGAVIPYRRGRVVRFGARQVEQAKAYLGGEARQQQSERVN